MIVQYRRKLRRTAGPHSAPIRDGHVLISGDLLFELLIEREREKGLSQAKTDLQLLDKLKS